MNPNAAAPAPIDEPPAIYLSRIRARTCYGTFRTLANVLTVAGVLGVLVQASWGLVVLSGSAAWAHPAGLAALISAPLSLCLVLLGHHWLVLQADMADMQIDASRVHGLTPPSAFATAAAAEAQGSLVPWLVLALIIVMLVVFLIGR